MFHRQHHKQHAKMSDWTSFRPQLRGLSHPPLLCGSNDSMVSGWQDEKPCIYTEGGTCDQGVWLGQKSQRQISSSRLGTSGQAGHMLALEQFCYLGPWSQC